MRIFEHSGRLRCIQRRCFILMQNLLLLINVRWREPIMLRLQLVCPVESGATPTDARPIISAFKFCNNEKVSQWNMYPDYQRGRIILCITICYWLVQLPQISPTVCSVNRMLRAGAVNRWVEMYTPSGAVRCANDVFDRARFVVRQTNPKHNGV